MKNKIESIEWAKVVATLNKNGFAVVPKFISPKECQHLIGLFDDESIPYRKTVIMERYRFGLGKYRYFDYPLPPMVQKIREGVYPKLVPMANQWMKVLKINTVFPHDFKELQRQCHIHGQLRPTPLILKYGKEGFNTLHQDLYGDVYFPLQCVLFLNEPEVDYDGGEFVLTQQVPRAQSKAVVLRPKKGDMLIFTTNFRPIKGKRGHYRAKMKHGVSEIRKGERHTLGIIFHDAVN